MNTEKSKWGRLAFSLPLSAFSLLVAACNILPQPEADTTRHFTLTSPVTVAPVADATTVRPVQVAGHLRSRAMAIRVGENEVIYDEDARWAEALDDAITQLLRARLSAIGGGKVVTVQVQRCELVRSEGNAVQVAASYAITPALMAAEGAVQRATFTASPRTWTGGDRSELVGQLRDALNELAAAIAGTLEKK